MRHVACNAACEARIGRGSAQETFADVQVWRYYRNELVAPLGLGALTIKGEEKGSVRTQRYPTMESNQARGGTVLTDEVDNTGSDETPECWKRDE